MESNNNQMLLLVLGAIALYFFMKYRNCSNNCQRENFTAYGKDERIRYALIQDQKRYAQIQDQKMAKSEVDEVQKLNDRLRKEYRFIFNNKDFDFTKYHACKNRNIEICGKNPGKSNVIKYRDRAQCIKNKVEIPCFREQIRQDCLKFASNMSSKLKHINDKAIFKNEVAEKTCGIYAENYRL